METLHRFTGNTQTVQLLGRKQQHSCLCTGMRHSMPRTQLPTVQASIRGRLCTAAHAPHFLLGLVLLVRSILVSPARILRRSDISIDMLHLANIWRGLQVGAPPQHGGMICRT